MTPRRVVVVGASAAGLAAAETLRRAGFDGAITMIGDEPSPPYDRPPLTKQILSGEWEPSRVALRSPTDLAALGLDLRLGSRATNLDLDGSAVGLADGDKVGFDGLIVATGVRPRVLPGGSGATGVHTLRTLADALALKARLAPGRRLVVVGAGFLGAEAAAVARACGAAVTVVEPAPVPMAHAIGDRVGHLLSQVHREHGVELRTSTTVAEVLAQGGRVVGVRLSDGEVVVADDVLVAIGSVPNTEWLDGSGLRVADGLVCDATCAAAPMVYGAGDVARWYHPLFDTEMRIEHRTNATEQGAAAARNLLGQAPTPFTPIPYFWSDQYDMRIRAYGYLRGHDQVEIVEGALEQRRFLAAYRTGTRLTGVLAIGMPAKTLHPWRARIAAGSDWHTAVEPAPAR